MKPRSIILTRFLAQEEKRKQLEKEAESIVASSNPTAVTVMQDITNIQYAPKVLSGLHVVVASSLGVAAPCSFFLCVGVSLGKLPTKFHYRGSGTVGLGPNMVDRIQSPK